jgi:hypothetical protein
MKTRNGFVSNSSSTSFIITNKSNKKLSLVDFVKENSAIIEKFIKKYDWHKSDKYNQYNLVESAKDNNIIFEPKESKYCVFGDEQDTLIGEVFDYMLRDGGKSKNFTWKQEGSLR